MKRLSLPNDSFTLISAELNDQQLILKEVDASVTEVGN
jgi:hypothetical protein